MSKLSILNLKGNQIDEIKLNISADSDNIFGSLISLDISLNKIKGIESNSKNILSLRTSLIYFPNLLNVNRKDNIITESDNKWQEIFPNNALILKE